MTPFIKSWLEKIDEELYFLTQDGYGAKWADMKKNDIKEIFTSYTQALLAHVKERVEKVRSKDHAFKDDVQYEIALDDIQAEIELILKENI